MKIKNRNRGVLSRLIAAAVIVFCCVMALPMAVHAEDAPEGQTEYHIKNADDFLKCVALSRECDTSLWKVYLDNDIDLNDDNMDAIVSSTVKHLSFGNKEHPFKGVFDGKNHTVMGLNYAKNMLDPERDTGFFAETNGAIIKNFLVKDANIWADFRGGIIVGKAVNTRFENVMVMESTLHVTCANNILNVITNAGFEGGLIAGELDGCTLYNCEVRGGRAVHNATAGVQAIGGEGLYMAAFAGYVKNSTIEYCRVTPTRKKDGSIAENGMTDVTNKYDVAVGALGGNNVYASGFVGCMAGNAKIIDCFSTARCYSYAASYVGVISVTRAWTGGLAGRILTAEGNELARSHFAGDLSSRQYNPIAVIPIIQNDVNLGGIGARANAGDATIADCYFKPSVSLSGFSQGTAAKKTIYALAGDGTVSGAGFGPWDDERYVTRELWEQHDYDFCAGTMRSTANGDEHTNEWAMDYKLNIPVHGKSVKTTTDFPGAGTATVLATMLGKDQSTSDPYTFAVSAVLAGTAQGLATGDTSVTFKQTTSDKPAGLTNANDGYRFMGWFREPGVKVNRIDHDNSWFDGKTDDAGKQVQKSEAHDKTSTYTADNAKGTKAFEGNDLFIASYEAQVLFYNVKGKTLDWKTGAAHDKSTDWYRYGVGLKPAAPEDREGLSASATFIGWTTQPSSEEGMNGAYAAITSDKLANLKNQGAFYPAGSKITVVRPTDFYPVYSDYGSNIITVFEGNEQDKTDNETLRDGVGSTKVDVQTAGDGASVYTVQVRNTDGTLLSNGGKLPDGYRFLGWYENKQAADGSVVEVRVSRDPSYTLPADVDLTVPHTYTARFEYRVDYYVRAFTNSDLTDSKKLCSIWNKYKSPFEENVGATYVRENIIHWGAGTDASAHVLHNDENPADKCTTVLSNATKIVAPINAYSHNVRNDSGANTLKDMIADTDFPGAGKLSDEKVAASIKVQFHSAHDRYHFSFWTLERPGDGSWTYINNPFSSLVKTTEQYYVRAMVTTDVIFYDKYDNVKQTATRRYESNLLQQKTPEGKDPTFLYCYPHLYKDKTVNDKPYDGKKGDINPYLTLQASPTDADMAVPGYKFLGWISTAEVKKGSDVWNYIYDVEGDSFTTSDPDKAEPYLVKPDFKVTQYQDAYPVYAKYDVRYTTNLHRAGFEGTDKVNVPKYDIAPVINADTDPATATVTPDITTPVYKAGGELYKLQKVEIELPNGEIKTLPYDVEHGTCSYPVEPGGAYTFVAYYSPLAVVYHLNATDVDGKVAQQGDMLGNLDGGIPKPTYDVRTIDGDTGKFNAFVGWTEAQPAPGKGYVAWSEGISMVSASTVVRAPMELYPVYRPSLVTVQSNIDSNLANPALVRGLGRTDSGDQISLEVKAVEEVEGIDSTKYDFVGWSRDYEPDGKYTLMTDDERYPLEGSEPFENVTYTAVYKKTPYKVRYHGVDGSVVFTATVDSSDERATGAGFVHNVEVPKVDESGNPVYDNDGNPEIEEKSVAYDPDAHSKIVALLDERAAANGDVRELFLEWQYVPADGAAKSWNEFKGEPVKGDMDLYPVTYRVVAKDTSDSTKPKTMTAQLKWLLDPTADNTVGANADKAPFKACFAEPFMGTQLTVTVKQASYGPGTSMTEEPVNDKYVSLYSLGSGNGSFDLANRLESKKTGGVDQGAGNAVFDFDQTHALTIVKKTTDASAMGQTFRFKVARKASKDSLAETRMVEVKVDKTQQENGETWYVGSVQFAAPAGFYTVGEDAAWAWRYQGELSAPGKAPGKSAELTISSASSAGDAVVTCVNTRTKDKWVDGGSRAKNVWENGKLKREDLDD